MWRYLSTVMGLLILMSVAHGDSGAPALRVTAECEDLRPAICDSVMVRVCATNESREPIAGWFAADYTWQYVPSDSLSAAYKVRIDSIEAAGGHACRWYPVSYRIARFTLGDEPFLGDSASLAPGASYCDTLLIGVDARGYDHYPGAFETTVAIWTGTPGARWADAKQAGSTVVEIPVPR
jgi:hypothetical protein